MTTKKSYGVIALRMSPVTGHLQVLLIRRRESLAACDFINSTTRLTTSYMYRIAQGITRAERNKFLYMSVDKILDRLLPAHTETMQLSKKRRKRVKWRRGHIAKRISKLRNTPALRDILTHTDPLWEEPEWEFPKGRKLSANEKMHACAAREFSEETGIPQSHLRLYEHVFCSESYIGTNDIHYLHTYFMGTVSGNTQPVYDPSQFPGQRYEISGVCWVDINKAFPLFRPHTARIKSDCLKYFVNYALMHPYCVMKTPCLAPIGTVATRGKYDTPRPIVIR